MKLFSSWVRAVTPWALALACSSTWACDSKKETTKKDQAAESEPKEAVTPPSTSGKEKPSAKEARKIIEALPPADEVEKVVNARHLPPYDGPTGSVVGTVRASGDPPPKVPDTVAKMDANCTTSRKTFGTLFREGEDRALADVLVAVTEYDAFLPAAGTEVVVEGEGCAWDRRTVAMTFGQSLTVKGIDNRPYVPELMGQPMPAQLFVLPGAPPVKLPPQKPGRFTLVDSMRLFNQAEVFVLPYATHDVTGLDGKFEIKGLPPGKMKLSAYLPQTQVALNREVTIVAGEATQVELVLAFDQKKYDQQEKPPALEERPSP